MPTFAAFTLDQPLPLSTFERLRELLVQMAQQGEHTLLLVTEETLAATNVPRPLNLERFTLLISESFSALLVGSTLLHSEPSSSTEWANSVCRVGLTFEPGAIATFLSHLSGLCSPKSALQKTLKQSQAILRPNDAKLQSEFTLHLIAALSVTPSEPVSAEPTESQRYTQVKQQNQTLEHQVVERTEELHDAMLAAQAANQAKSEFLAAVSHELRTPLTYIIGMSATLMRWSIGELSTRQRGYLQTIHDNGERLLAIINDILDLSQLEAGRTVLKPREFSLSRLGHQTLRAMKDSAREKGVELTLDLQISPSKDSFVADPTRVQQILFNLLSNAVKFTPEGGRVTLRLLADDNLAVFQVKDTGIGIPDHQRPLLFQKFQQLDPSYHREYEGVGLGLSITQQLVDLHHGWIDVTSTVGVGSVFTVRLPSQQRNAIAPLSENELFPIPAHPFKRVVLIESHDESANVICDMLTAAGYHVIWMLEGSTAVSQIEILQPIVVIVAMQSTENSEDIIHHLRHNPATIDLKLVALVETDETDDIEQCSICSIAGADACLTKPIRPDEILHKVTALASEVVL
ncbi:hypothetical protein IQ268_02330 [Oculatella sp. LEGE 06141]|uniref:ATP-binding response regulator n=1 Tax=Oculatella sp. LEGE 06141 TaxID=1828648 RepID=UPI0018817498|nr:ATP-binding protein [Oculatella sp. LEGE 06141]MBE9177411.1 hypothetical protein [Oculatella sp. LEGE 06141]